MTGQPIAGERTSIMPLQSCHIDLLAMSIYHLFAKKGSVVRYPSVPRSGDEGESIERNDRFFVE